MSAKLFRPLLIVALMAALGGLGTWLGYGWGWSNHKAVAAEDRAEAIESAVAEKEVELMGALAEQRSKAIQAAQRAEELQAKLRDQQRKTEEYANSEAGAGECFGPEGVEAWNAL